MASAGAPVFDPMNPAFPAEPYRHYRRLRPDHPVFWHPPTSSWMVSRYADVRRVPLDSERFSADPQRAGEPVSPAARTVQNIDGPDQRAVRRILTEAMRTQSLPPVEAAAAGTCPALLDRLSGDPFDAVADPSATPSTPS